MHAYDRLLGRRCLGLSVLLALVALGIAAATDEPGSTLGTRLARLAALLPAIAVVAQQIVLAQSRARGELAALSALGCSPLGQVRGVVLAGVLVGLGALVAVALPGSDVRALFPVVPGGRSFGLVEGALWDPRSGALYSPDGAISFGEVREPEGAAAPSRSAALGFVAPLACVAPFWGAAPMGLASRLAGACAAFALAVLLLHAVAARRLPAACLVLGALPLALQAVRAFRARRPA